ncbi:MAG: hypothetical protein AABM40_04650 [Chloroflexota bacterium]
MPRTAFDPAVNGFAFTNSFQLSGEERAKLSAELASAIDQSLRSLGPLGLAARVTGMRDRLAQLLVSAVPDNYGLCGGMAFAALDYFRTEASLPRGQGANDQPPPGSPLRLYLWQRLLEGWVLNGARFLEWTARLHFLPRQWPFDGGPAALRNRSRDAWRLVRVHVDAHDPVPIGLVGELVDPFQDHQVLATGYEPGSETAGTIYTYDMNCPESEQTIMFDTSCETLVAAESCPRVGNPLRGFFCETYLPLPPPPIA